MFIGALSAGIVSFVLNIGWAILGVVFAVLFSGAAILDPLYASSRIGTAWGMLGTVLGVQGLHTFITAPAAGVTVGFLNRRIRSNWLYLLGAALTVFLHYLFTPLFAFSLSALAIGEPGRAVTGFVIALATLNGPLIGLAGVFAARRWAKT
jgi:hypothetical protein